MKKILLAILAVIILLIGLVILMFGHSDIPVEDLKTEYAPAPSSFVEINGMQVHYRDEGSSINSTPIVLIHGTGASLHTFDEWTRLLKNGHRVIRMDLPGFGLTGPFPNRDYTMKSYSDFLHKLLLKLNVNRCILAGNSLGGRIAWSYTLDHPGMVDKLVLIDAAGYPTKAESMPIGFRIAQIPVLSSLMTYVTPRSMVKSSVENVYQDKSRVSEELVDRYFELTLREGNRQGLIDRMNTLLDSTAYQQIHTIQQPTLILWGDNDYLIPVSNAHRFHQDLPNGTLVIMQATGHVPMEERPLESLAILNSFLKNN